MNILTCSPVAPRATAMTQPHFLDVLPTLTASRVLPSTQARTKPIPALTLKATGPQQAHHWTRGYCSVLHLLEP